MKGIAISILFAAVTSVCMAQFTAEQRIQDSVIGWWANNYWDRNWKPQTEPIAKKKEAHVNNMVQWMKKSYTPVGGLGTVTRYLEKNGYGVKFMVWNVSHDKQWTDARGNFKPIPEENTKFYISANKIWGSYPVSFINQPGQLFVFTWQPDGALPDNNDPGNKKRPVGIHPNAAKYITIRNEMQSIMLAPNNKLPFTTLTKGEYLQLADEALAAQFAKASDYDKKAIDRIRKNIAQLKEKYKNSLTAAAIIKDMQPSMYSFDGVDPFDISSYLLAQKLYYPLYKLTADVLSKLNAAEPQWITVALPFKTKEDGNQLYEMYTAVTENINYDYIYNYFFDPEKIKGIAYKPANEEQLTARLTAYLNKNKVGTNAGSKKSSLPAGVHFSEDFSNATSGTMPAGWTSRQNNRGFVIETPPGEKGKWLFLDSGADLVASSLQKPFPANFTLEFDLLCTDYTNRAGRTVTVQLSGPNTSARLYITPGNEQNIKIYPSMAGFSVNLGRHTIEFSSYSNKKTKAHVKIVKSGTSIIAYINGTKVESNPKYKQNYESEMALGAAASFAKLEWTSDTVSQNPPEDKGKVYISNIIITKN
jgi:hypothetical protein